MNDFFQGGFVSFENWAPPQTFELDPPLSKMIFEISNHAYRVPVPREPPLIEKLRDHQPPAKHAMFLPDRGL